MGRSRASSPQSSATKVTTTIHDQLIWGSIYRNRKTEHLEDFEVPLKLAEPPIGISQFKIDRVVRKVSILYPPPKQQSKKKRVKCRDIKYLHAPQEIKKIDLLQRYVLGHTAYSKILSVPRVYCYKTFEPKKKTRDITELCSPRILQLAIPNKKQVLSTWQRHGYILTPEMIQRLQNIIHTDNTISMSYIRQYFKTFDKRKRKRKQMLSKKAKQRKKQNWLSNQLCLTSKVIVNFFITEHSFLSLNFRQLMISSMIIKFFRKLTDNALTRYSTAVYPLTIIEICDKMAFWLDRVVKLLDFQPIGDTDDEELLSKTSIDLINDEREKNITIEDTEEYSDYAGEDEYEEYEENDDI